MVPVQNKSDMEDDLPLVNTSDFQYAVLTLLAVVFIIGTIGNGLSLSVILFYRRLRLRSFNIITMFLIVQDLISCSIVASVLLMFVLVYVRYNVINLIICRISFVLQHLNKFGSLMTMAEIAILRVISLSNNVCARKLLSKTAMAIMIAFNIIVMLGWATLTFSHDNICDEMKSQGIDPSNKLRVVVIWAPFIIVVVSCYTGIACYTKIKAGRLASRRNARGVRYDIATIRTCTVIIIAFVVCHLPFLAYVVLASKYVSSVNLVDFIFYFEFHLFSQAGNPIIMFCTCSEFRKHVLMFIRFLFRRCCRHNRAGV